MHSKEKLLKRLKFYLILDEQVNDYSELFEIVKIAAKTKVDILQIRDKHGNAKDILDFSLKAMQHLKGRVPFIVNDRVDIALASGASGVHVGTDDLPIKAARKMLGSKAIIGASCQSLEHAWKAQAEKADYIGFGSVFRTLTKPDRDEMDLGLLEQVVKTIKIPVFAIGGISQDNVSTLLALGVKRIAVCRAVCEAEDVGQAME